MSGITFANSRLMAETLLGHPEELLECVKCAYLDAARGVYALPPPLVLRFQQPAQARVIALVAAGPTHFALKWIASFPTNLEEGLPRASAIIILNHTSTGRPVAILEGAYLSACRTAAGCLVVLRALMESRRIGKRLGIVGAGFISTVVIELLQRTDPGAFVEIGICDTNTARQMRLAEWCARRTRCRVKRTGLGEALAADVVVLATNATEPHIDQSYRIRPGSVVFNLSLRDLHPETVLASHNIVDSVDHCLSHDTSLHLAERKVGNREFVHGTIAELLGSNSVSGNRPILVSPFGLGVLDLAVAEMCLSTIRSRSCEEQDFLKVVESLPHL